ncbi:MAG: ATP-binding protein [Solirubrobacterales bacterium]|nr:ATP-binding protein [Solirubrobacterales bacterium]
MPTWMVWRAYSYRIITPAEAGAMTADAPSAALAAEPATLSLTLESRPETLTLVRGMLSGVAELLSMDPELLDDLKTAVSEACNNVVLHAYPNGSGPLAVSLNAAQAGIEVLVRDAGVGIPEHASADDRVQGVGLPVIRALTDKAEFRPCQGGGTEVWMHFAGQRDGRPLFQRPDMAAPDDGFSKHLAGDAVVSVSPIGLLGGVLGRLSRALAASARFSLDRFSDVYLVTDAIAAHSSVAASGERIGFAIRAGGRRLELTVGPLRAGSGEKLRTEGHGGDAPSPLELLSDQLECHDVGGYELLRVVMVDHRRWPARS